MIAFDTNLLLRYLTHDDPGQTEKVVSLVRTAEAKRIRIFVSHIALCECLWVLSSLYRMPKSRLILAVESLLNDQILQLQEDGIILNALEDYRRGQADFPDYLIGGIAKNAGAAVTYTFDKALRGAAHFRVL